MISFSFVCHRGARAHVSQGTRPGGSCFRSRFYVQHIFVSVLLYHHERCEVSIACVRDDNVRSEDVVTIKPPPTELLCGVHLVCSSRTRDIRDKRSSCWPSFAFAYRTIDFRIRTQLMMMADSSCSKKSVLVCHRCQELVRCQAQSSLFRECCDSNLTTRNTI